MKKTEQWGWWTPGHIPDIGQMINHCLEGMKHEGIIIPKDIFGSTTFKVSYRYSPPIGPEDLAYLPDGVSETGYTSIKLTYDVESRNERTT